MAKKKGEIDESGTRALTTKEKDNLRRNRLLAEDGFYRQDYLRQCPKFRGWNARRQIASSCGEFKLLRHVLSANAVPIWARNKESIPSKNVKYYKTGEHVRPDVCRPFFDV